MNKRQIKRRVALRGGIYKGAMSLRSGVGDTTALDVDREAGVIRNVPVITAGTTKPPGSGGPPFDVDATTLKQVADAINASSKGIASRLTHAELEGIDSIRAIVGKWRNARIEGGRVLADFHLLSFAAHSPMGNAWEFLLGIAENAPEMAGVSIFADDAWLEPVPDTPTQTVLRIGHLKAIDWVGEPAANPSGMLSAATNSNQDGATDGAVSTEAEPQGSNMEFTEAQLEYLQGLGLAPDASAEMIAEFIANLTPEQRAAFDAAASAASAATPAAASAPAPVSAPAATSAARGDSIATLSAMNDIATLAGLGGDWAVQMMLSGKTIDEARRIALAEVAKRKSPVALRGSTEANIGVGADRRLEGLNDALRDAISLRAGVPLHKFDAPGGARRLGGRVAMSANGAPETRRPNERVNEFASRTVLEMGRHYLVSLGYTRANSLAKSDLAALLMSKRLLESELRNAGCVFLTQGTGDFPYLLADVMGKSLRSAYELSPKTWPTWCRRVTAPDYKEIKRIQLSEAPDLTTIHEGGEYTFGALTESREVYQIGKYGKGLAFTREMLINDDLDAFSRVPSLLGNAAARLEENTAFAVLTTNAGMADGNNLFSTAHANLTTGALSVSSLGTARSTMRKQTALGSSDPLDIMPKFLLVPENIATTAEQLIGSTVDPSKQNATPNPFANRLTVISSARLDTASTTVWYLLADFNQIDTVEMAFLEGEEGPVIEEEDEFNTDARKVKVRHNVAAKAIDWRGMVRSSGS